MNNPEQFAQIFQIAQNVAKKINLPKDGNMENLDMGQIFTEVNKSLSQISTSQVEKFSKPTKVVKNSEVINELSEEEEITQASDTLPRTKDLHFTLNVSLKHLYHGKTKNVAVKRKRFINTDSGSVELTEERKILSVNIKPGMCDEDVIIFEGEGDEKKGHIPGDVIITLCYEENSTYSRIGNNLFMTHNISLSECYDLDFTFKHINGEVCGIKRRGVNIMSTNNLFKLENLGMPIQDSDNFGDLYIKFSCDIPDTLDDSIISQLKEIIPPLQEAEQTDNYKEIVEVSEEELDSFYYDQSDDGEDEDDEEDEDDGDDEDEY
jgi:DnaJ-class molecular chaperone